MKLHFKEIRNELLDIKEVESTGVQKFGRDNAYPNTMEYLISTSVTAKNCVEKSSKAISGIGIKDGFKVINKKGHTINDIIRSSSREYTKHNNAYLWVGYNLLGEVSSIEVIPVKNVRVGLRDDSGYNGKFVIYDNFDMHDGSVDPEGFQIVDRFNPNQEVVQSQIKAAGGIQKYKGQVVHIQKYMNEVYSLPDGDCVITDMIAEINASEFKQKGSTDGFLNVKIMAVQPFNSSEERNAFKKDLESTKGSKGTNSVILLESADASAKLEEQILLQDLTSSHNDKLFEYTESSVEKAICKAFNVPIALVNPAENGLFGNSGEMYSTINDIMWQERSEERMKFEEVLTVLLNNFKNPIEGRVEILRNVVKEDKKIDRDE
jgi:hypothetical protein